MQSITVDTQCDSCTGTGLYRGFAEPEGVAVICATCGGTGKRTVVYRPFQGRVTRNDVRIVKYSRGSLLATGVGPVGGSVTYGQFLAGIMPQTGGNR